MWLGVSLENILHQKDLSLKKSGCLMIGTSTQHIEFISYVQYLIYKLGSFRRCFFLLQSNYLNLYVKLEVVGSIFWSSPSFRAQSLKLVKVSGNSHSGGHWQCEHRIIAILQTVATAFTSPANKEEAGHYQDMLFFNGVESDIVSA